MTKSLVGPTIVVDPSRPAEAKRILDVANAFTAAGNSVESVTGHENNAVEVIANGCRMLVQVWPDGEVNLTIYQNRHSIGGPSSQIVGSQDLEAAAFEATRWSVSTVLLRRDDAGRFKVVTRPHWSTR